MLTVVQTIFYLVSSIAIMVIGVLLVVVIYYLIGILKDTRNITDDITNTYHKTKKNVKKIISSFNKNYDKEKKS